MGATDPPIDDSGSHESFTFADKRDRCPSSHGLRNFSLPIDHRVRTHGRAEEHGGEVPSSYVPGSNAGWGFR